MNIIANFVSLLFKWYRERVLDKRETTTTLARELEGLAELMSEVLKVADAEGNISKAKLPELDLMRKRVWSRWVSILGTDGYATQDAKVQSEIEECIRIAHAAPGAYVEELLLIQQSLVEEKVPSEVRTRFSISIHNLQNLVTQLRLNQ